MGMLAQTGQNSRLSELKLTLERLESAVQEPSDDGEASQVILRIFPRVFDLLHGIMESALSSVAPIPDTAQAVFALAHERGWLKGDLAFWMQVAADYKVLRQEKAMLSRKSAIVRNVRACSYLFWETYELLNAKLRWQAQVSPAMRGTASSYSDHHSGLAVPAQPDIVHQ